MQNHPIFSQLTMPLKEHINSTHKRYAGNFLQINEDVVVLPNQAIGTREYVIHKGAAMIVPVFNDGTCLLEYQYRHPINQVMIEFPAGKRDAGECMLTAAKRELLEETGYRAEVWHDLGGIYPLAAYSTEVIQLFIAKDLHFEQQHLDVDEHLQTFRYPINRLQEAVEAGAILDAKTIIGIWRLLMFTA